MLRLILLAMFVAVLATGVLAVMGSLRAMSAAPRQDVDEMPRTVQRVAYILLLIVMIGVAAGWLGAA